MRKTNAVRILDRLGISYELREYAVDESDLSAPTVARKVGLPLEQVFKTLVTRGDGRDVVLACIPGGEELDLKALAAASGHKHAEMAALRDVQPLTGYVRGGVSPVGTKKTYPFVLDETALAYPFVAVSAGVRGMQMLVAPADLLRATEGRTARIGRATPHPPEE